VCPQCTQASHTRAQTRTLQLQFCQRCACLQASCQLVQAPTQQELCASNVAATNIHPHICERCASTRNQVVLLTHVNAPDRAVNAFTSPPWACSHASVFATSASATAPHRASLHTSTATPQPCSSSSLSTSKCSPTHASSGSLALQDPPIAGETQRHAAHKSTGAPGGSDAHRRAVQINQNQNTTNDTNKCLFPAVTAYTCACMCNHLSPGMHAIVPMSHGGV